MPLREKNTHSLQSGRHRKYTKLPCPSHYSPLTVVIQSLGCVRLWDAMDCSRAVCRLFCPLLSPRICSNSYPLSGWCYLTISSSAALFFCVQPFPVSQLFASGGQSIGASALATVLSVKIQGWVSTNILH